MGDEESYVIYDPPNPESYIIRDTLTDDYENNLDGGDPFENCDCCFCGNCGCGFVEDYEEEDKTLDA